MRQIKTLFFAILVLTVTGSAQTRYYGAIDLGSKGAKASLYAFVADGEERVPQVMFNRTINTKLVSSMDGGRFTDAGIHDASDAVKQLIEDMGVEAKKNKITVNPYYIVGSSGVAKGQNKDDLVKAVKASTGIDMTFITAENEGYYGLLTAVPLSRRGISMYIDTGSGNTKLGCIIGDSARKNFKSLEIPFGSVSGRKEGVKRNPNDITAGIEQVMGDVKSAYVNESMDTPCLRNRQRIYWTGGAAWATATFTHPEKVLSGYVVLNQNDIKNFLTMLNDGTWNQKKLVPAFPKNISADLQNKIRDRAEKDRLAVMDIFAREDLIAGVSIMKTVMDQSNNSAVIQFVRDSSFLYGYALEIYKEDRGGQ